MNCNNCGAKLKDGAKLCPVCGAMLEDESNYTLLSTDERYDDVYSSEDAPKKHSGLKTFIILILVVLLAGGGAYYYFTQMKPVQDASPQVSFTDGSGIINRDQKVIYVTVDNKNIEFIHGVSLYEGDITALEEDKPQPVTTDYEYTKNIDSTFRAIFFDTEPLALQEDTEYTYTFEIFFSFIGSDEMYPYTKVVTFNGNIEGDASDVIFDHTMVENTTAEQTTTQEETTSEATTEEKQLSMDFIYEGYWYTEPHTEGENLSISAFSFSKDKTYKVTHYDKAGSADWSIYSENGRFETQGDTILLDDGSSFVVNDEEKAIFEESNGEVTQSFTNRKYNSRQNAEDFFGI